MSTRPRARGTWAVALVAVAVLVGIASCSPDPTDVDWPDDPTPAPAAAPQTATSAPVDAQAVNQILAVVVDYRETEVASYADPPPPHMARRNLSKFLADPLLSQTVGTLRGMHDAGVMFEGRLSWEPAVAELDLDETPPTAVVHDCVEAASWESVFEETGEPVPGDNRPDRYLERLYLTLYPEGWLIYAADVEEAPC